jgi:uncharacterized protein with HEPN domain
MHDKELVLEILSQIHDATKRVMKRFEPIHSVADFTDSEFGMEKLDAICMQLAAIGEGLKNVDSMTQKAFGSVSSNRMEKSQGDAGHHKSSLF